MRKAIVAGSFDPFTNGHLSVVKKAAAMFDEVTVIIGVNSSKKRHYDSESMCDVINSVLLNNGLTNCKAICFEGLIAVYCATHNIKYTVRGIRNNMDFNYENEIAKINRLINANLETVYLPADNETTYNETISSSMVREFLHYGIPVDAYVPEEVMKILRY